jgi:3-hydroxyisobutyrate dehydrogenase-like beta-hydroxyacid dehydrogenase
MDRILLTSMNIGFVGLGNMGRGMARNLLRAGHQLTVYNRTRAKAEELIRDGASVAESPAEAAQNAEAVLTMLADDQAVEETVFGENGIASTLKQGAAHISNSTLSVGCARRLASEHQKRGQGYISAPVFGRPDAAENKKLLVIVAGSDDLVTKFHPVFEAIGRQTYAIGTEPWQANAVKISGNFMIATLIETFGEAFAMLRKAQVNHALFHEIITDLFGSPVYKNYGKLIVDEQFDPAGFALKLGFKDTRLALELAQEFNAPLPIASLLRDHYLDALAHGQEKLDWASLAKASARKAALE